MAIKFLVPVARINLKDCERMAAVFAQDHCESRQAGQLYSAGRNGSAAIRKRILDTLNLFFKAQRQTESKALAAVPGGIARSGDGSGDCESCPSPGDRRDCDRDGYHAMRSGAATDRGSAPSTGSFGGANRKGAKNKC
jgi:hypothetical protein